ncbi:MAG TPA: mechanosensitive ion channel domain-containing protein [Gammaproteobacteria bacterium]|nr:mechanosensitive ion channel domain-containing protein [Gammaproteobacteria bacterium]
MENQNTILELQEWTATLAESVRRVAFQILEYLPSILGAVVLLLVGWGVARLLRYTTEKITEKTLVRLAHTRPMDTRIKQPQSYSAAPRIASRIVFWVTMLFFILAAAEVLELKVISGLLGGVTSYLPRLLAGLLILFIGLWFGEATRAVLTRTSIRAGVEQGEILGRLGQTLVLLVVFAVAAGQIGIDNTVLVALVATLFGVTLGAIALAFAFGAKTTIANMLGAQSIAQAYQAGDTIRIGDIEGKVLRITRTSLILETRDGQALIPAKRFSEQESVNISGGSGA